MKEILYTVKFKLPGQRFWTTVKKVRGDGFSPNDAHPIFRYLVQDDDTIIHLPLDTAMIFSSERAGAIERTMSQEARQPIQRS